MPGYNRKPVRAEGGRWKLPGVQIFATGHYRGRDWTEADIDELYQKLRLLGRPKDAGGTPYHQPTAAIGHEEDQGVAKQLLGTDEPAAGVIDIGSARKVREWVREPSGRTRLVTKIRADVVGVPDEVADWVARGKLRTTSAEIYDDFVGDDGTSYGPAIRRVSLLGSEIPQVKSLGALPGPVRYAERVKTTVITFAEGDMMDREQMLALVKQSGASFDPKFLDSLSDEQLAMLIASLTPAAEPVDAPLAPDEGQMSDAGATPAVAPAPAPPPTAGLPVGQPSKVTLQFADLPAFRQAQGQLRRLQAQVVATEQMARERHRAEKRGHVQVFCDRMVAEGKVLPAELDRGADPKNPRPTLFDRLMRADGVQKVHRFGDSAGPVTELEAQMAEIEARPKLTKFGEQVRQPSTPAPSLDQETRRRILGATPIGRAVLKEEAAKAKAK